MGLADPSDVEAKYGSLGSDEYKVSIMLDEAEEQVRQRFPNLDDRITAGRTSLTLVVQVLVEMVISVLRNRDGFRTVSSTKTEGPYSESQSGTYSSTAGVEGLTLTRRHLRLLGQRPGAQTVPVGDPALAHPLRRPDDEWGDGQDRYGLVWPTP